MGWFLLSLAVIALVVLHLKLKHHATQAAEGAAAAQRANADLQKQVDVLSRENASLSAFREVRDVAVEAARIGAEAQASLAAAKADANAIIFTANSEADAIRAEAACTAEALKRDARMSSSDAKARAQAVVKEANVRAARLITDAETRAQEIAGDAYVALQDADRLERAAVAMRNVIDGYGDRYLKPTFSLFDQLADDYSFDDAGRAMKSARALSTSLVASGRAASCEYVEANRRDTAIRFVLDAFNGKVDTILGRVKSDNAGTLDQQIRDAFALVNHNGRAFRSAQITPDYLASRLEELKWAAAMVALRERDKEEQRRIREQIREEDRARREIERALRDAAKEEDSLQRAMAKVQAQVARANDQQRAAFEAQLAELKLKLVDAEARNQRALSMAQQTKAGHVYVISNPGSFGEAVVKVGMTRRLEPQDRVRELGDASVPFPFDVHAMIWSEDAPSLEHALHKRFLTTQVNKVNPRKEFFRVPINELRQTVEAMGLHATWTLTADASQFRETQAIERALEVDAPEAQQWLRAQSEVAPDDFETEVVE